MEKFILIVNSIDWLFAGILLIGGRYWGGKYFLFFKNSALNFLAFATAFGIIWILIKHFTLGIPKSEVADLFLTYIFTTSFYEVLGQRLFEMVEKLFPQKKEA